MKQYAAPGLESLVLAEASICASRLQLLTLSRGGIRLMPHRRFGHPHSICSRARLRLCLSSSSGRQSAVTPAKSKRPRELIWSENQGITFEVTELPDPRLDPETYRLDVQLAGLVPRTAVRRRWSRLASILENIMSEAQTWREGYRRHPRRPQASEEVRRCHRLHWHPQHLVRNVWLESLSRYGNACGRHPRRLTRRAVSERVNGQRRSRWCFARGCRCPSSVTR